MTLAFEDANSKLLDVVTVADVDAEERVDDRLFGRDCDIFGQDFEAEIWSRF